MFEILVKDCSECPLFGIVYYNERRQWNICQHPKSVYSDNSHYETFNGEPPPWCPLRKEKLTLEVQNENNNS